MFPNAECEKRHGLIHAFLVDVTHCSVSPRVLDALIASKRVQELKRSRGWATIGIDPVKSTTKDGKFCYWGPEKRSSDPGFNK